MWVSHKFSYWKRKLGLKRLGVWTAFRLKLPRMENRRIRKNGKQFPLLRTRSWWLIEVTGIMKSTNSVSKFSQLPKPKILEPRAIATIVSGYAWNSFEFRILWTWSSPKVFLSKNFRLKWTSLEKSHANQFGTLRFLSEFRWKPLSELWSPFAILDRGRSTELSKV